MSGSSGNGDISVKPHLKKLSIEPLSSAELALFRYPSAVLLQPGVPDELPLLVAFRASHTLNVVELEGMLKEGRNASVKNKVCRQL
jgi:hypothetical protein